VNNFHNFSVCFSAQSYAVCVELFSIDLLSVDVIKTRYLADGAGRYKSIPDCVLQLYRSEGTRGFFKVSDIMAHHITVLLQWHHTTL